MRNSWKRVVAGVLALTMVAGALPANVGGLLTGGEVLVASALEAKPLALNETYSVGDTIINNNEEPVFFSSGDVPDEGENLIRISKGGSLTVNTIRYSDNYGYKWLWEFQNYTNEIANVDATRIITNMAATYEGESYYTVRSLKIKSGAGTQDDPYVFGLGDYDKNPRDINDNHIEISNVFDYTGSAQEPVLKWVDGDTKTTLVKNTDYTIMSIEKDAESVTSAKDAGTYQFIIKGKGQYADSVDRTVDLRINPVTLDLGNIAAGGALVNGVPSQLTYTGEEQAVKLYYKKGSTYVPLTDGTDYVLNPDYPDGSYFDGELVYSAATDASDNNGYEVIFNPKGNYKISGDNTLGFLFADWSIAKADLKAGTDYTAPTGSGDLKYKADDIPLLKDGNTGSVTNDSNTGEPVGTMKYAATRGRAVSAVNLSITSIDDVNVGDIYSPISEGVGIRFPKGCTIKIGTNTYNDSNAYYNDEGVTICQYPPQNGSGYYIYNAGGISGSGIKITAVDKDTKAITAEIVNYNEAYSELVNNLEWNTDVPQGTDVGNWYVWYKVEGDSNHNDTKPAYVTSKIDYKKSTLTLAKSLGAVKVTEVANGTETEVTAKNGVYTLTATKTYKIYTENTVSTDEKTEYRLSEAYHDKANDEDKFEYEYTLKLAVDPAYNAYTLSHLSNWTGKVYSSDPTKLYIADGAVTLGNRKLAATLKANNTYYYGDPIDESSIEIDEAYKDLLKVNKIYFCDSTGANVDIKNAEFGTYSLRAEILVDNNDNGKFDDENIDLSYTVYKDVEYMPRPMVKNDYFLALGDKEYKLEINEDSQTVTVPNTFWYNTETDEISLTKPEEEDTSSGGEPVEGEPEGNPEQDQESNWVEETLYTYDQQDHIPYIVVRNGGNNEVLAEGTIDEADKDYANSRKNADGEYEEGKYKDAGSHYYQLIANRKSTKYEVATFVNIQWTIAKADINGYISVAPKNNVDTDDVEGNDAIVYDGAVLDGTDFEVTRSRAYENGGDIAKALVDEFIAQLTATPATETTPAVAAKTTVDVAPAIGKVYSDNIEYPVAGDTYQYDSEYGSIEKAVQNSLTINYPSTINNNLDDVTVTKRTLTIEAYGNLIVDNEEVSDSKTVCTDVEVDQETTLTYNNDGSLTFGDHVISAKEGYILGIKNIGDGFADYGATANIYLDLIALPVNGITDGKSNIKDASVEDEVKRANVTVKNSNFKDIEFKQTLTDDGKIDDTVDDKSIPVTIAKRAATITPDEDNRITYRDLSEPTLKYEYEKAATEEALLRGVVANDEGLFDSTKEEYVAPIAVKDFNIGELNDAKSYEYEIVDSKVFANYELTLPTENAPTFTVDPLDLNNIEDLSIVLTGKDNDWTTLDNSGYYTYDGKTKTVEVASVGDKKETAEFSADDLISEKYTAEKSFENNGVNLVSDIGYVAGNIAAVDSDCFGVFGNNSLTVTVPEGKTIVRIHFTYGYMHQPAFNNPNDARIKTYPDEKIISVKNVNSNTFTLSLTSGRLAITKVYVEYSSLAIDLTADTDYTVGGMTKSATVGDKTVQVKGKGNYTGVAKAKWEIKPVENVESLVTFKINDDAKLITLPQDAQYYNWYYTGEPISCGAEFTAPDSDYAQDAEVTVKYTRFNNITGEYEEVDEAVHQGKYKVNVKVECDGYSPVEFNYDINISPKEIYLEDTPFTINYGEDYSDHTDELLALFVEKGLLQSDADLIKQMLEDGTLIWYYDYDEDYDEGDLYPTWSEDVLEAAAEEAVKEDKNPEDFRVIESMIHKLYGDAVYQVANGNDNDIILVNPIIKPKSIKSDDVTVEFTNGNTVVLDENGFVEESSIIVKDTGILNNDGEPTVLVKDTDYELNVENTATEGEFTLEIVGKGNYKSIRKVTFTAVTIKPTAETTVEDAANSKLRLTVNAGTEDSSLVAKTGVIFYRGTTCPAELTIESAAANNDIYDFSLEGTSFTGTVKDSKGGVHYVGYTVLTNGTVKYTDVISTTINDEILNAIELTANTTVEDAANSKLRLTVNTETEDSSLVAKTGVIFYRGTTCPAELTIESAAANNDIYDFSLEGTSFTGTVKDSKGGVHYVGYTVLVNGTVKYTDIISTKISDFVD